MSTCINVISYGHILCIQMFPAIEAHTYHNTAACVSSVKVYFSHSLPIKKRGTMFLSYVKGLDGFRI